MPHERLSRVGFISIGGSLLAACSTSATLPPLLGNASRTASRRIAPSRHVTDLGHAGFQISTNRTGNAIALHTSSGEFVSSIITGKQSIRITAPGGAVTMLPSQPRFRKGWNTFHSGAKFKLVQLKSGNIGALIVDAKGNSELWYTKNDGKLYAHTRAGATYSVQLGNLTTSPTPASAAEAQRYLIDNVGTWTGDEDFVDRYVAPGHRYSASTRSAQSSDECDTEEMDCGGDTGDLGDSGDLGDTGGDTTGDTGGDVTLGDDGADYLAFKNTPQCQNDLLIIVGSGLVVGGSGILAGAGCLSPALVFTLSASCVGAVLVFVGSYALYVASVNQFLNIDHCLG